MMDWTPFLIAALSFLAMAGIVFVVGQYYSNEARLRQRLSVPTSNSNGRSSGLDIGTNISRFVARHFDDSDRVLHEKSRLRMAPGPAGCTHPNTVRLVG